MAHEEASIMSTGTDDVPTVDHRPGDIDRLLGEAVAAMPAIGKDRTNTEQRFMFRGYDDIMGAVNGVFGARGLYLMPHVLEFRTSARQTRSGSSMYVTHAHVAYTIRAADGSYVRGSALGEGTDVGDKATSKAMTMALKSFLTQALAITDHQTGDPDASSAPPSSPEEFRCPVCAEEGVDHTTDNQQAMRDHLVSEHGWSRQPDGRVTRPRAEPPAETATAAPPAAQDRSAAPEPAPAAPAAQPEPAAATPSTAPAPVPDEDKNPSLTADIIAGMSKKDLVPHLTASGLPTSGTVAAMRERLTNHLTQGTLGDPTPAPSTTSDATPDDATSGDTPGDEQWQCPDCDAFAFATEKEYEDHWYAAHGDGSESDASAEDPDATDTATPTGPDPMDGPCHPDTINEIKTSINQLSGEKARAYAKYRREANLPKPDELTTAQALSLIDFLEELSA